MSEKTNNLQFENFSDAEQYIEHARELYRQGEGEYRGRRTPEQELIAEVTSDEARLLVDGAMLGLLTVGNVMRVGDKQITELDIDEEAPIAGGLSWKDFRGEFERLLVGFGGMTSRLHRDGFDVPSYADLRAEDRMKAASALFGDFLSHNALRFGVDSAGVKKTEFKTHYTDDGGVERLRITTDKDLAKSNREVERNMGERGFSTGVAAHPAGKISPDEYIRLRREFPEMDKDHFDRDVSFYTDVRKQFEQERE